MNLGIFIIGALTFLVSFVLFKINAFRKTKNDQPYMNEIALDDFLEYIIDIIKSGIENNEFKNVDPRITALSILVNIEGIHWFTLFDKSGVEAHEYINTISNFILNGLKKKSEE